MEGFCSVNDRFGGNAADVKASSAQFSLLDEHGGKPELTGSDRRNIATGSAADNEHLVESSSISVLNEHGGWVFKQVLDPPDEHPLLTVDHSVVEGRGQVHQFPRHELVVLPGRSDGDFVHADDGDL